MPKVFLSKSDKQNERLTGWVYGRLTREGLTQTKLAEMMGLSQQLLSYKLKTRSFTFGEFVSLIDVLNPDAEEIVWLVKGGE